MGCWGGVSALVVRGHRATAFVNDRRLARLPQIANQCRGIHLARLGFEQASLESAQRALDPGAATPSYLYDPARDRTTKRRP